MLRYRTPKADTFGNGPPSSRQDTLEAIRVIHCCANDRQIDPKRTVSLGFSIGGRFAGSASMLALPAEVEETSAPEL